MKFFQKIKVALLVAFSVSMIIPAVAQQVSAQTSADEVCNGIATASGTGCNGSNTTLDSVVANGINIFSIVVGIVAVVMIMVAGFTIATAGGDAGKVSSGKKGLAYATVGLVIVATAQTFVHFVLNAATPAK